jgi:hypothetical protein
VARTSNCGPHNTSTIDHRVLTLNYVMNSGYVVIRLRRFRLQLLTRPSDSRCEVDGIRPRFFSFAFWLTKGLTTRDTPSLPSCFCLHVVIESNRSIFCFEKRIDRYPRKPEEDCNDFGVDSEFQS